jgi:cell division cycle protein 20 (cofactor of APC complex)
LDAPELKDDYYLNLLDWSSRGTLCIGLGERVYLYTPKQITELCCFEDEYVCSVSYHPGGQHLAVGLSNGKTHIYDVEQESLVRTLKGHSHRVSSAAFTYGLLYTGSKDSLIIGHDHRAYHHINTRMMGHRGEVCGLRHDACGLASGSNDNLAIVWDVNMGKPRFKLSGHKAAVKALAWCPWQRNLLATGGGSSDKTMRFWNIETGKCINVANTESQVCSLLWNKDQR